MTGSVTASGREYWPKSHVFRKWCNGRRTPDRMLYCQGGYSPGILSCNVWTSHKSHLPFSPSSVLFNCPYPQLPPPFSLILSTHPPHLPPTLHDTCHGRSPPAQTWHPPQPLTDKFAFAPHHISTRHSSSHPLVFFLIINSILIHRRLRRRQLFPHRFIFQTIHLSFSPQGISSRSTTSLHKRWLKAPNGLCSFCLSSHPLCSPPRPQARGSCHRGGPRNSFPRRLCRRNRPESHPTSRFFTQNFP